jgi:hypothetical protein
MGYESILVEKEGKVVSITLPLLTKIIPYYGEEIEELLTQSMKGEFESR